MFQFYFLFFIFYFFLQIKSENILKAQRAKQHTHLVYKMHRHKKQKEQQGLHPHLVPNTPEETILQSRS